MRRDRDPQGEPTYKVERDAPPWEHPESPDSRWRRRVIDRIKGRVVHDAYPDHAYPFEDIRPLPVPEPRAVTPRKYTGDIHLLIQGRTSCKIVPLAGASLDSIDLDKRMMQGWVLAAICDTMLEVQAMDEENDKGQGLAEYALILALIAIVTIAALLLLGDQISKTIQTIGNQIPG